MPPVEKCGLAILIVDDDLESRNALRLALECEGYTVATAASGQEALAYLRNHAKPCLILLDLMMPNLSGWEFRERQRQDPALAGIPVVVLSGVGDAAARADALGDVGYLQKPPDVESLLETVRRFTVDRKPEILVVEDQDGVRKMLEVALRHYGFTVWPLAESREAVDFYRQHHGTIAAVLLNVHMAGEMDGPQVLAALRGINPQVRCCLMAGSAGAYTAEELAGLGVQVLRKPFRSIEGVTQTLWQLANL